MTSYFRLPPFPSSVDPFQASSADWLPSLGFVQVDRFEGLPLSTEMANRCAQRSNQRKSSLPESSGVELWMHPVGALVVLSDYRLYAGASRNCSSVRMFAIEDWPLSEVSRNHKACGLVTGVYASMMSAHQQSTKGQEIRDTWTSIVRSHRADRLVPLSRWSAYLEMPGFDNSLGVLASSLKGAIELCLDWPGESFLASPTIIPAQHSRLCTLAIQSATPRIKEVLNERAAGYPPLGAELGRLLLSSALAASRHARLPVVDRKSRKDYAQSVLARCLVEHLSGVVPGRLDVAQQKVCQEWIDVLSDPRQSARTRWCQLPSSLPEVTGLAAHDLLLDGVRFPGTWEKLASQIRTATNDQLMSWVSGREGRLPLALSVSQALLHVQNRSSSPDEQRRIIPHALGVLDRLVDRLGVEALVWETPATNVWAAALGSEINLPTDEDLIELHEARLNAFVGWARARGVRLPGAIRWSSFSDKTAPPMEFAPHNFQEFASQWAVHGPVARREDASHHWKLLGPLVALSSRHELMALSGSHLKCADDVRKKSSRM